MKIYTEIKIHATAESVWSVLTDFDKFTEWNPFIHSIAGNVAVGDIISVRIQNMRFKPQVLKLETNKSFSWHGKLWVKGLFDGLHSFELLTNEDGTITFVHQEEFSGILVGLFSKKLNTTTKAGFIQMNAALKQRVEEYSQKI